MRSAKLRRCAHTLLVLLVVLSMTLSLTGCKESFKLAEIIYDQSSEEVDYDNSMKVLVQDEDADETSDALPLIGEEDPEDTEEDEPEPDDEDNQDDSTSSLIDGSTGTGATSNNSGSQQSSSGSGMSSGDGSETEEGEGDGEAGDGNDDEGGTNTDGTTGARSGADQTYYNDYGEYSEVPTGVDYVAAVGELATVVSMLVGDQGALKYCDAEWKARDNLARVLGSRYNSEVYAAWEGDGTDAGDLSDEWIEALIADEELEAVLVMSGTTTLTSDQKTRLQEAGIIVLDGLPDMTTASHITDLVTYLGKLFAAGHEGWTDAQSRAEDYVNFHDELLEDISSLVGTSTTDAGDAPVSSGDGDLYTVYVDSWAIGVTYADSATTDLDVSNGVGIVRLGYLWSPLTYYMSVGGAISTAGESAYTGTTFLWQFNSNFVRASFTQTGLVTKTYESGNWFDYTMTVNDDEAGLGTESFPAVVVKTQQMKALMEADKNSSNQSLYKIYERQTVTIGSVRWSWVGPLGVTSSSSDSPVRYATIGVLGFQGSGSSGQLVAGADYEIYVNPEGLFESWTDGSIESVLETAWIAWRFRDALSQEDVENYIRTFYSYFYDYTLSDDELAEILAGPES